MSLLQEVKDKLIQADDYEQIARDLSMSPNTLRYIANGRTPNPGVGTVEKIAAYFREAEAA